METVAVGSGGGGEVSPLRRRMIQDMELAGLTGGTRKVYIRAVLDLVKHYGGKRPEEMNEDEVYRYLLELREKKKAALGTFQTRFGGLKFLFYKSFRKEVLPEKGRDGGTIQHLRPMAGDVESEVVEVVVIDVRI